MIDYDNDYDADAEDEFRNAYESAFGVRPEFSVASFSPAELLARADSIREAHAAGRFA